MQTQSELDKQNKTTMPPSGSGAPLTSYQILTRYKAKVIEEIEAFSKPWRDISPSKETAVAIIKLIKRLPLDL
jgi:hypothetical protein